ncbi:hypothetical protein HYS95_03830 [Candidatus Daviesbacteria bacterium]|nr:hypothetical protein [Candidatus Daviesbacteria bacterium]
MNRLSVEFSAERDLSPVELEGLREIEEANARMVGYIECEAVPEIFTNGHEPLGRLDFAQGVTSEFMRKPGFRRWKLTEKPHKHESLNHNPKERALVEKRRSHRLYVKRINGNSEPKRLPNVPTWRFKIPNFDLESYNFFEDSTQEPTLDWRNPEKCLSKLESEGELEAVVDFTPDLAARAGREIAYFSQITPAPYLPPRPQSI